METASKNPPEAAGVTAYISEVRLESSSATVAFSEPCPCCGNRKRRCLPPARSRKKLLVFEPVSADVPSPSSSSPSPTRPVLLRSDSSPAPPSSRRAGLSPPPSAFLRSYTFPSTPLGRTASSAFPPIVESPTEAFRSPPSTIVPPFVHLISDPVPPTSPPSFLLPAPSGRRVERSNSNESTPPAAATAITSPASSNKRMSTGNFGNIEVQVAGGSPEGGVAEWRKRQAVRVSVNCDCGVVREVVLLQQ